MNVVKEFSMRRKERIKRVGVNKMRKRLRRIKSWKYKYGGTNV
jgi:hypothetical protein